MTDWYVYPIGHGYITQYSSNIPDSPHYADDLQVPFHTEISSILDGTVKEEKDNTPWGGEIYIVPDDKNLPEMYMYHLDTINENIKAGTHVVAGESLGLSGGENIDQLQMYPNAKHPTQDNFSTGPHIHIGWFSNWKYVPEIKTTIPEGPDITPFLQQLRTNGLQHPTNIQLSQQIAVADPYPGGSLNPLNWPSEAQDATSKAGATIASDLTSWLANTIGPFLLRVGIGAIGAILLWQGTQDVLDAFKSLPETKYSNKRKEKTHVKNNNTYGNNVTDNKTTKSKTRRKTRNTSETQQTRKKGNQEKKTNHITTNNKVISLKDTPKTLEKAAPSDLAETALLA